MPPYGFPPLASLKLQSVANTDGRLVIKGGPGKITMFKAALPVPIALVAKMVEVYVPVIVGMPLIRPVVEFTPSPFGNPPRVACRAVGRIDLVLLKREILGSCQGRSVVDYRRLRHRGLSQKHQPSHPRGPAGRQGG